MLNEFHTVESGIEALRPAPVHQLYV